MKRILFGRKIDENEITSFLGSDFECHFTELISIEFLKVTPHSIANKSLLFTSKNGVMGFFKNQFKINEHQNVFCVGSKTQKALTDLGIVCHGVFKNSEELLSNISEGMPDEFLHFSGNLTLETLKTGLQNRHINYEEYSVYKTRLLDPKIDANYDALVFFSPSGVRSFCKNNAIGNTKVYALGETTAMAVQQYTPNKIRLSPNNQLKELLSLIKENL